MIDTFNVIVKNNNPKKIQDLNNKHEDLSTLKDIIEFAHNLFASIFEDIYGLMKTQEDLENFLSSEEAIRETSIEVIKDNKPISLYLV